MHKERCTSGSEGERQKPTMVTSYGADARPLLAARLLDGRWFRVLTVVDQFTRECLLLLADSSLTG